MSVEDLHPKAPSPGRVISEHATKRRSKANSDTKHTQHNTQEHGPLSQLNRQPNNSKRALIQPRGTHTGDSAASDEDGRIGCSGAKHRANLEDQNRSEIDLLCAEVAKQSAEGGLERSDGEEIGGAVPLDVVEGLEVCGDAGDGDGDYGCIDGDEEGAETER